MSPMSEAILRLAKLGQERRERLERQAADTGKPGSDSVSAAVTPDLDARRDDHDSTG